jgi:hypothetical protein
MRLFVFPYLPDINRVAIPETPSNPLMSSAPSRHFLRPPRAVGPRKRAHNAQLLELIFEDNRLNVDAGEREVRPPAAPNIQRLIGLPQPAGSFDRLMVHLIHHWRGK